MDNWYDDVCQWIKMGVWMIHEVFLVMLTPVRRDLEIAPYRRLKKQGGLYTALVV